MYRLLHKGYNFLYATACIILLALPYSCKRATEEDYKIEKCSPIISSSLSSQRILAIAEDKEGFIWIATGRGLNKYNGRNYAQYFCGDNPNGLPDNQVRDVMCDSHGRLWVATIGGVCIHDDQDRFEPITVDGQMPSVWRVKEDSRGRIFISYKGGIALYDEAKNAFHTVLKTKPDIDLLNFGIDPNDNIWLTSNSCVESYDTNRYRLVKRIKFDMGFTGWGYNRYGTMQPDGLLWLLTKHGPIIINTITGTLQPLPKAIAESLLCKDATPDCMSNYGDGAMVFYSPKGGLSVYYPTQGRLMTPESPDYSLSIGDFQPTVMFSDSHHNLWMGSEDQGIYTIYSSRERFCSNVNLRDAIGHQPVLSVSATANGDLWMVTRRNGLLVYRAKDKRLLSLTSPGLKGGQPRGVYVDNKGYAWIGSANRMVKARLEGDHLSEAFAVDLPLAFAVAQAKDGSVWIVSTSQQAVSFDDNGQRKAINLGDKNDNFIPAITSLSDGRMLVGVFLKGLYTFNPKTGLVAQLKPNANDWKQCLHRPLFRLSSLMQDGQGNIWIGTLGNGALVYNLKTNHIRRIEDIQTTDISSITEDAQGFVWLSTAQGLYRYDPTTQKSEIFVEEDGIGGNQFLDRSSCRMPDGTMVFGGTHGLTIFDPISVLERRDVKLRFGYLTVHNHMVIPGSKDGCIDKRLDLKPTVNIHYDQNSFRITFAAIDYGEYEREHYYYKLEGFDKHWVDGGTDHSANYANLPSGHYTFRVRAVNRDLSHPLAEDSIKVVVHPAPWNTWWAWMIYIVLALVVVAIFLWTRREMLAERIEAQEAKRKLRELLQKNTETDNDTEQMLTPQDKHFMDELYKVLEAELDNADLNADLVAEKMLISRTKLYYKVKELTGVNPSEFFRTYKLNRAAQMIREGGHTVSEVAYMTGFTSLSYFSTAFKKQFGITPSQYK